MASQNVQTFTDQNFQTEVLQSDQPVLVDFSTDWCPPCKILSPTIDELADQYAGRVKVGKVNTDDNHEVSMKYGITKIPTVMLFQNGEVTRTFPDVTKKNAFEEVLNEAVPA